MVRARYGMEGSCYDNSREEGRREGGGTDQRIAERQKRREAGDTQDII